MPKLRPELNPQLALRALAEFFGDGDVDDRARRDAIAFAEAFAGCTLQIPDLAQVRQVLAIDTIARDPSTATVNRIAEALALDARDVAKMFARAMGMNLTLYRDLIARGGESPLQWPAMLREQPGRTRAGIDLKGLASQARAMIAANPTITRQEMMVRMRISSERLAAAMRLAGISLSHGAGRRRQGLERQAEVDALLRADPALPTAVIARRCQVGKARVRSRRAALGLPPRPS